MCRSRQEEIAGHGYYNYATRPMSVDEMSGRSVFYKDEAGDMFHTYSSYARGGEMFLGQLCGTRHYAKRA